MAWVGVEVVAGERGESRARIRAAHQGHSNGGVPQYGVDGLKANSSIGAQLVHQGVVVGEQFDEQNIIDQKLVEIGRALLQRWTVMVEDEPYAVVE